MRRPPELRAGFLATECHDDTELRREVEELLARDEVPAAWERTPEVLATVPIQAGTLLGPYRILRTLGSGGMGTVYQAEDTRLGRKVAIKLLKPGVANSPEMRQRFEREARVISALNHPHICALYDVGSQDGAYYLVMEHVEGETLATHLRNGPLPFSAAMVTAAQVADALGAAHAKGIVHRDLKPENIMLTSAGAKVLDFGLAKTAPQPVFTGASGVTQTETLTTAGAIAGTLAYMAPEQMEGRDCDHRTDIFAFGLVLYEMVARRRAFPQDTQAALIAAVMASEPDFAPIQKVGNLHIERVLRGCLAKQPAARWQNILDVKRVLEWAADTPPKPHVPDGRRRWWPWLLAAATLACAILWGALHGRREEISAPLKFSISLNDFDDPVAAPAVSPDGSQLAYIARNAAGVPSLWIHHLDTASSTVLPDTTGAHSPFWSPDGRWIGFHSDGKLSKIRPSGGRPQKIADLPSLSFAAWSAAGDIIFSPSQRTPLYHLHESGGTPRQITTLDLSRTENSHRYPIFLPGGQQFLFLARCSRRENNALYIGSLESNKITRIAEMQSNVQFVPARAGRGPAIVYVRDGVLVSQEFDETRLIGEPVTVVDGLRYLPASAKGTFSISNDGRVLVYAPLTAGQSSLKWYDRSGRITGELTPPGDYTQPRISPDGARVVFSQPDSRTGNRDLWTVDVRGGATSRLTTNPANDWWPVWSPDSRKVLFGSDRQGNVGGQPYLKTALEAGVSEAPVEIGGVSRDAVPSDWSRTGWMAFISYVKPAKSAVWVMRESQGKAVPFLETESSETGPRFSPDGKWLAYVSNETGLDEIYVRPFREGAAGSNDRIQVSTGGGDFPAWGRSGEEVFYISSDLNLKQFDMRHLEENRGTSKTVFKACPGTGLNAQPVTGAIWQHPYDVAPDGRFLFNCLVEPPGRFVVWTNWRTAHLP